MKKNYCIICDKYRKFKNRNMSCHFNKTLVFSINYGKCGSKDEKCLKKKNYLRY